MTEIAKFLSKNYDTSVIYADIAYDANVDHVNEKKLEGIKLIKSRALSLDKNKFFNRILGSLYTTFSFAGKILRYVAKEDVVFAVTNPFLLVILLGCIRRCKKFRYVLLVHDVFPENAVPAGVLKNNSFSYKIMKTMYDWSYSMADELIVLGRDMEKLVASKVSRGKKIHIVENWFDSDLQPNLVFDRNNYLGVDVTDKIVIGFAGNMGRVQYLEEFLKIFASSHNEKLHMILVGDGACKNDILNFLKKNGIDNVHYLGPKPRSEQSYFLNSCDIGLVTLSPAMYGLGVPSKSYNLLALGKPILFVGDEGAEIDLLIKDNQIGWSFNWDNPEPLRSFLTTLNNKDNIKSEKAKILANERFAENIVLSKINQIIK